MCAETHAGSPTLETALLLEEGIVPEALQPLHPQAQQSAQVSHSLFSIN